MYMSLVNRNQNTLQLQNFILQRKQYALSYAHSTLKDKAMKIHHPFFGQKLERIAVSYHLFCFFMENSFPLRAKSMNSAKIICAIGFLIGPIVHAPSSVLPSQAPIRLPYCLPLK